MLFFSCLKDSCSIFTIPSTIFQKYFINILLKVKYCVLKENKDLPCIESSSLLSLGVPCKYREIIMSINQGEKKSQINSIK